MSARLEAAMGWPVLPRLQRQCLIRWLSQLALRHLQALQVTKESEDERRDGGSLATAQRENC
jgi:hypothetical protein